MSIYYHEFTPGFNWWYATGIACIVLMAYLGAKQYRLSRKGRISRRYRKETLLVIVIALALAEDFLVVRESWTGLVQNFLNHLTTAESWQAELWAGATIVAMAVAFAVLFYAVGRVSSFARVGYLYLYREACRRKRQEETVNKVETVNPEGLEFGKVVDLETYKHRA